MTIYCYEYIAKYPADILSLTLNLMRNLCSVKLLDKSTIHSRSGNVSYKCPKQKEVKKVILKEKIFVFMKKRIDWTIFFIAWRVEFRASHTKVRSAKKMDVTCSWNLSWKEGVLLILLHFLQKRRNCIFKIEVKRKLAQRFIKNLYKFCYRGRCNKFTQCSMP